jgi:CrcB protein
MSEWLLVMIGGAAGAVSRHITDKVSKVWPGDPVIGTFLINLTGSLLLGFIAGMLMDKFALPSKFRHFMVVGFLGSYTTFSTFTVASVQLLREGQVAKGILNIVMSVLVSVLFAYMGVYLGGAFRAWRQ